jgi:hypothetical protein
VLEIPLTPPPGFKQSGPGWSSDLSAVIRFSPKGQDWIIDLMARALGGKGPRG